MRFCAASRSSLSPSCAAATCWAVGGEEFLLILPDTDRREAIAAAERIRSATAACGFPQVPATHPITVTIGVATWREREEVAQLIARADRALYLGKERGRNLVVPA